jgi:hypothetical protein
MCFVLQQSNNSTAAVSKGLETPLQQIRLRVKFVCSIENKTEFMDQSAY